jgi:hypothetical protein
MHPTAGFPGSFAVQIPQATVNPRRPALCLDFYRQQALKPARYRRSTVLDLTT